MKPPAFCIDDLSRDTKLSAILAKVPAWARDAGMAVPDARDLRLAINVELQGGRCSGVSGPFSMMTIPTRSPASQRRLRQHMLRVVGGTRKAAPHASSLHQTPLEST